MANQENKILFILLHWNDTEDLFKTYSKIIQLDIAKEIIIFDNNSSHQSKIDLKNKIPKEIVIWNDHNLGFGSPVNEGVKFALSKVDITHLCILNNDIDFNLNEINSFISESIQNDNFIGWAPIIVERDHATFGGKNISINLNTRIAENEDTELAYLPGTFALFDKEAFKKVGLLETKYFFGGEMADFCNRLAFANLKIHVNKDYPVQHNSNPDTSLKTYYSIRNRFLYIHKFHPRNFKLIFKNTLQYGRMSFGSILKFNFRQSANIIKAVYHGLINYGGEKPKNHNY